MVSVVGALPWRWMFRVIAVAAGGAAIAGLFALALVAGRPHLSWAMSPARNELVLQLTEGHGPLAGWLYSNGSLSTTALHGQQLRVPLDPGRTTHVDVTVASLWTTHQRVSVTVPPLPQLTGSAVGGDALTLNFSTPVMPRNAPCGLRPGALLQDTVAFPRTHAGCTDSLEVTSVSGEWTTVPVSVPALPTPAPAPPPPPPPPPAVPRLLSSGPPGGNAFYITIDDGWYPNNDVLALMQQQHIPITTFLLSDAAATHVDFWKAFIAAGGEIEDHTINHPYMTKLNAATEDMQWSVAAQRLHALLGVTPLIGRPPYGDWNAQVVASAGRAGLHSVVMWTDTMNSGHLAGAPLRAGSIVLFHWTADVYQNLQTILALGAQAGLHPALLGPALQQSGY